MATAATQDLQLTFAHDTANHTLVLGLGLTPAGDLAQLQGTALLTQRVMVFLAMPQGSDVYNPADGNAVFGVAGQASTSSGTETDAMIRAMLQSAEAAFLSGQNTAVATGDLTPDELAVSFGGPLLTHDPLTHAITVSFTVLSVTGASSQITTTLSALTAAAPATSST